MPLPEREEIWECHTLASADTVPVREYRGDGKDLSTAERAISGSVGRLIRRVDATVEASGGNFTTVTGKKFFPDLEEMGTGPDICHGEHGHSASHSKPFY
jgi:hypothetical protein